MGDSPGNGGIVPVMGDSLSYGNLLQVMGPDSPGYRPG